jgi:hypothetical protein
LAVNLSEKVPQAFASDATEGDAAVDGGESKVVAVDASPIAPAHQP